MPSRSWKTPTQREFDLGLAEKCPKAGKSNASGCYYRSSTIKSFPVNDSKTVFKYRIKHNVCCTHVRHSVLKGSCLYGCEGKFNSLSLSQSSESLLEPKEDKKAEDKEDTSKVKQSNHVAKALRFGRPRNENRPG